MRQLHVQNVTYKQCKSEQGVGILEDAVGFFEKFTKFTGFEGGWREFKFKVQTCDYRTGLK